MKENNKLIAEFMGYKFYNNLPQQRNGYQLPKDKGTAIYLAYSTSELQYHTSWDWLMPVVEKIDDMFGEDDSVDNGINRVHNAVLTFDINQVYGHVVDFINEYNKNK
tara:strand:+ start:3045 stop:3365 length:321 start_codon:yes stop_codon:yes gene_type:complete